MTEQGLKFSSALYQSFCSLLKVLQINKQSILLFFINIIGLPQLSVGLKVIVKKTSITIVDTGAGWT